MAKTTRKQRARETANIEAQRGALQAELDARIAANGGRSWTVDEFATVNALRDCIDAIPGAIQALDFAYRTRNWTASDFTTRDLVTSNID